MGRWRIQFKLWGWRVTKIITNSAECRRCGDVIVSLHRHHWVSCGCWDDDARTGIFVDGGTDYIRRGAFDLDDIIDRSVTEGDGE